MTHNELVDLSHKFVLKNMSCGFAVKEIKTVEKEIVDVLGFGAHNHSILIEVKVSRQDFLKDAKKSFRKNPEEGVGKYRFYCCPKDLIKIEDLPNNWGLIYCENNKLEIVYNKIKNFRRYYYVRKSVSSTVPLWRTTAAVCTGSANVAATASVL